MKSNERHIEVNQRYEFTSIRLKQSSSNKLFKSKGSKLNLFHFATFFNWSINFFLYGPLKSIPQNFNRIPQKTLLGLSKQIPSPSSGNPILFKEAQRQLSEKEIIFSSFILNYEKHIENSIKPDEKLDSKQLKLKI
ncbi:hypothetical protein BpHYR1_006092 [Brachionus plicatilis]|uniref:Uncharacterized protein n=1 Tax=Brachionus plicatilis TaxID=10195 RepID=A0A3M7SFN1_BRAPC|nr:hypothetical protein BpHYR1_006092 [Brachionus plicatilis]